MRKRSFKKGTQFILLNIFLIFTLIFVQALILDGPLYSRPTHVSAEFHDNLLYVKAVPEIWNPTIAPISSGNSFRIAFDMHIFNNTRLITYTKEIMSTLVFYPTISPGLNEENLYTAVFNFTYNFNNKFNQTDLFLANISINTVSTISSQTSITGTTIVIENNDLTTISTHPKPWGGIELIDNAVIFESTILIVVTVGIYLFKLDRKNELI